MEVIKKTLLTLNQALVGFISIEEAKDYNGFLKQEPKIEDFINFDLDGFELNDNEPIFKGWVMDEETSSETKKVAKLTTADNECRIYFHTDSGIIIVDKEKMSDNCTYNDLAIFFEGKLEMN